MSHFFEFCMYAVGIALAVQFGGLIIQLGLMAIAGLFAGIASIFDKGN